MLKLLAKAICCCVVVAAIGGFGEAMATDGQTHLRLPGSRITALAPMGWECDAGGSEMSGNEVASVMSCLPWGGGVPVTLSQMIGSSKPVSLDGYLQELTSASAKAPAGTFIAEPDRLEIAGKHAVEAVSEGGMIADNVGGGSSIGKMISDAIVFEDNGMFFECKLETTPVQYTAELRRIHHGFCDSLKFDAN